jgi:hypothetical protein
MRMGFNMFNITYVSVAIPTWTGYDFLSPLLTAILWIFALYGFWTFLSKFIRCCDM